jgi:hypothetical protein
MLIVPRELRQLPVAGALGGADLEQTFHAVRLGLAKAQLHPRPGGLRPGLT